LPGRKYKLVDGIKINNLLVCGPDNPLARRAGERLAESLRRYRLPKETGAAAEGAAQTHVEEDYGEAPLDEAYRERLARCDLLVIICVPSTRRSGAISQILDYYSTKLGRSDRIIAVLAEGEPVESFPPYFIQTLTVRQTQPDGSVREITETIEPVAADLRGQSGRERRRALTYETVRIVAALAGIHPDILERRHEKRRKKRLTAILTLTGSIMIAVAVIFSWLGVIAVREGQVAETQTEIGSAMVDRLFVELPRSFQGQPEALGYVDDAILNGLDALLEAGSANAELVDLDTALAVHGRDGAETILRKASIWRRYGEWDRAAELYIQGIGTAGVSESHSSLFLDRTKIFRSYPEAVEGYALYILLNNSAAPIAAGDLIVEFDGKPLYGYSDYRELLADAMPGASFGVTALVADEKGKGYKQIELRLSVEQLRLLAAVQV